MSTGTASTGTYTFLFTDLEGSSHLWEAYPESMKSALARHDAILRQAIEGNQGRIVKTTGDGCHAAFETAAGAIKAALAAQRALIGETWAEIGPQPLRVRMGIHTGEAESRAGDYYGTAVNRAARLMSVGHGGQVLVSAVSAELVFDVVPPGTSLLDLGEHRLKDLVRPEHIYQLVHESLPAGFPPLKSLDSYPNNLPIQITSFIGRDREIEEARRLLSTARLITLTGSGGTGKTRLALQVAADVLPDYTDGVWLVELAPVTDPDLILQTISGVLELHTVPGIPAFNLVTDYLRSKRTLIILDNCEHLIHACADLADHLLHTCPHLTIIATSREGLNIAGEVSYHVPSLSIPDLDNPTLELITASEAVQLFMDRATALNPHFELNKSNVGAIAQICRRLDGVPLALELAAARTRLFSPEQIATRLNDRFRLLTGGSRTALPRQQTLRTMIDWSYDLLSGPERALLRRLSVFVGGWTFEAAEAVCADLDVLTLLELLVNKSLVIMEEDHGEARYRMLETIRQYAREKLIEAGEVETLRNRHFDYFLHLSVEAEPDLRSSQAYEWFERLAQDYDNLSAAIEWGQDERPEDALILVGILIFFWGLAPVDNQHTLQWLDRLLVQVELQSPDQPVTRQKMLARARGLSAKGLLITSRGDALAAIQPFLEAIALEREVGDSFHLAFALAIRSTLAVMIGDPASGYAAAEESALIIRTMDDKRWLVLILPILATIENRVGDPMRAAQIRQELHPLLSQIDHPLFMPPLLGFGYDAIFRGQVEEAWEYFSQALKIAQKMKSRYFTTVLESELAHLARQSGDLRAAKDAYCKLIWKWKDFGQVSAIAHQLESFAMIAQVEGEAQRAVRLFGAAEALRQSIQVPRRGDERPEYDDTIAQLHSTLTDTEFNALWSEGRTMDLDQAVRYAVTPTGSV